MEITEFHRISDRLLQALSDHIETADKTIEVDYEQGVLTITLPDDKQFVLNKHQPTMQIWVFSPFSGAHKFFCNAGKTWVDKENNGLVEMLKQELACLIGFEPTTFSSGN
jgi:iron donor protein CyaY